MSRYRPELTADGSWTLRNLELGQSCHSSAGAWAEARERYVELCQIRERCQSGKLLRVLDLGTGPGWNLAALLEATAGRDVELEVLTIEIDPEVIRLGELCVERDASEGGRWLAAVRQVLQASADRDGRRVEWGAAGPRGGLRLSLRDAREELAAQPVDPDSTVARDESGFDAVFLDAFSPAADPDLWSFEFLGQVARRMKSGALLSTYTTSLNVRASLAAHGLAVGPGPRVGDKHQGTLAAREVVLEPFCPRTQRKLDRRVERQLALQSRTSGRIVPVERR